MSEMDVGGMGYGPMGAQCALHPEQPAARTCTRCGSFMCSTCSEGGAREICPTCQERLGMDQAFPLTRDTWSFSALWDYCFELWKREWLNLSLAVLILMGIGIIANLVSSVVSAVGGALQSEAVTIILAVVGMVVQQAVSGAVGLGFMRMIFKMLQGHKPELGLLFSQFHKTGKLLVTLLLVTLMALVPIGVLGGAIGAAVAAEAPKAVLAVLIGVAILAFIPLLYFLLPLTLMQSELAYNDDASPVQIIRNCYAYARGERTSILGVSLLGGLVGLVGIFACCVGIVPAMGLSYLLLGGLFLALRSGAEVEG